MRSTWIVVLAALATAVVVAGFARLALVPTPRPAPTISYEIPDDPVDAETIANAPRFGCAEGLESIPAGCAAFPTETGTRPPLLVYFHGLYEPGGDAEEMDRQKRVARLGTQKGYVVLAPRGELGACTTPAYARKYCWPSNERNESRGAEFVSSFAPAIAAIQARTKLGERYVLGFSNGGYFASLVAERALFPAKAIAIAHAGPAFVPVPEQAQKVPLLLLSADLDLAQGDMIRLEGELERAAWPHDAYARDGGHALPDEDIELALSFFAHVTKGDAVPLDPPLSLHRPVFHMFLDGGEGPPRDEAAPEGGAAVSTTSGDVGPKDASPSADTGTTATTGATGKGDMIRDTTSFDEPVPGQDVPLFPPVPPPASPEKETPAAP